MANRFLNNITINDEYTLPSADGTADQIITTDGAGQLSFVDQNTISSGSSEKVVIYVKNTHTASIAKGTPVYITGTVGATDTVEIAPADAGNSAKMPAVGLLDETLAVNDFGYVITGGFMDNITTDPIDGATPSSNNTVYVKSGGGLTLTKPTGASNLIQNIAKVGKVSGGNSGSLIVSSILRTNDVPNLSTGKIWVGDSNTIESTVVHLDETNGRMGVGTTSPGAKLTVVDDILLTGSSPSLTLTDATSSFVVTTNTAGEGIIKTVADKNIRFFRNDSVETMRISATTGNVGIGTTSPSQKLHVNGTALVSSALYIGSTSATIYSYFNSLIIQNTASTSVNIGGGPGSVANDLYVSNGSIGIGTTSPSEKLHVYNGTAYVTPIAYAANQSAYALKIGAYNSTNFDMGLQAKSTSGGSPYMSFRTTSVDDALTIWGGSVGIGGIGIPSYTLDVNGVIRGEQYLRLADTAGTNRFSIRAESTYGTIDNGTNTLNTIANAHIFYRGASEIMRIHSNSNVGIGTTSPTAKLHVDGDVTFDPNDFVVLNSASGNYGGGRIAHFRQGSDVIQFGDIDGAVSGNYFNVNYGSGICEFFKMNVGIDNSAPSYLLDVGGDGRVNGTFRCVSLIQTSQRDQKTEIELVGKETTSLPIKRYKYKSGDDNKLRYGVVAEDIESNYPELVERDAEGIKGVKYIDFLVRKIAELETEKRTLVNWRHYHSNTSYNMLYDTGMTTAFPYAYGSIPAPYDMYFTSFTLVNNPYSSYNKGPEGNTAIVQAYVNNTLVHEIRDITYGNNPFESITVDFGQNVALRQGQALQIRFQANGAWRYCNSTIILTEK